MTKNAPKGGDLEWRDGDVPVSKRFDDPYFSLDNGLAETEYVFLRSSNLPGRFRDGFHIAELGFGTGLNLLATLRLWRQTRQKGRLHVTSFEAFPMSVGDMLRAQRAFPEVSDLVEELSAQWKNLPHINLPDLSFRLIAGDARIKVPQWNGAADAWFLDGFSPAKNPELWEASLLASVFEHTCARGTAATYTAAGEVRRRLQAAGFVVERVPGFGRKRHMTRALRTV